MGRTSKCACVEDDLPLTPRNDDKLQLLKQLDTTVIILNCFDKYLILTLCSQSVQVLLTKHERRTSYTRGHNSSVPNKKGRHYS